MSLKDELNSIKQEISNEEKLLEQAFHIEKFFKKNKKTIIAAAIVLIGAFAGFKIYNYIEYSKLKKANSALLALEKNPNNSAALNSLKDSNPKLYALYKYSFAVNSENKKEINSLSANDTFLKDVIAYHKGVAAKKPTNSEYYKNLVILEKAYLLLKEGKKAKAKNILATIPQNSAVAGVARLLQHYTIK